MATKKTTTEEIVKKPVKKVTKVAKPEISEKKAVKTEKVEQQVAKPVVKAQEKKQSLSLDVYGIDGKVTGKVSVPSAIFGETVNKQLIAQAVRVYLANQRQGNASTKTRGEVDGSTRKIYRQKGTGRARHGSVRAPIFVKGGIVFGPKPRDYSLDMPKKMKRKALFSALSSRVADKSMVIVSGLSAIEPKTKQFVRVLQALPIETKKSLLIVLPANQENVIRAVRNVSEVSYIAANRLNTYTVLSKKQVILMQEALESFEKTFLGKE